MSTLYGLVSRQSVALCTTTQQSMSPHAENGERKCFNTTRFSDSFCLPSYMIRARYSVKWQKCIYIIMYFKNICDSISVTMTKHQRKYYIFFRHSTRIAAEFCGKSGTECHNTWFPPPGAGKSVIRHSVLSGGNVGWVAELNSALLPLHLSEEMKI